MFYSPAFAGNASKRYAAVHAGSRIESASPHGLVKLLFDELMLAMDASALSFDQGDLVKARDKQVRALSIVHALEGSLDFDNGGDIAISLAQIYRETRRLMVLSCEESQPAHIRKAHALIVEIAEAWNSIA
ncbi:MAG: flagellar export chaperone FliS [Sphingobium sp.]